MARYTFTHTDPHGHNYVLIGVWEAWTAEHALEAMLLETDSADDGCWEVFEESSAA